MTPQECLIKICKFKNDMVYNLIQINMFDYKDYFYLSCLSSKIAEQIILRIQQHIKNIDIRYTNSNHDGLICPWCIYKSEFAIDQNTCSNCQYKINHNNCNDFVSLYKIILEKLNQHHITHIYKIDGLLPGISNIIDNNLNKEKTFSGLRIEEMQSIIAIMPKMSDEQLERIKFVADSCKKLKI